MFRNARNGGVGVVLEVNLGKIGSCDFCCKIFSLDVFASGVETAPAF